LRYNSQLRGATLGAMWQAPRRELEGGDENGGIIISIVHVEVWEIVLVEVYRNCDAEEEAFGGQGASWERVSRRSSARDLGLVSLESIAE
jgi:hypothetical protein